MLVKSLKSTVLAILLMASVSNADQFGIQPGDGFNDDQHAICDNPYDPNCGDSQPGYPGQPVQPDFPDYQDDQSNVKTIYLGRSVRDEVLNLRQLAGLGQAYRGWEVVSVRARTRPDSPYRTTVQLLADRRNVATQVNPGNRINLVPNQRLVLGSSVRELEMYITGSTFVDEIQIELRSSSGGGGGYNPQPPQNPGNPGFMPSVDLFINRTTVGNDRIDLGNYFNMHQYRGYRIEQVIVYAQAQYNVALADLLVNGFNQGTLQFDRYMSRQNLYLNQRPDIGGAASSLVLYTRGNMTVQRVTLILSRY